MLILLIGLLPSSYIPFLSGWPFRYYLFAQILFELLIKYYRTQKGPLPPEGSAIYKELSDIDIRLLTIRKSDNGKPISCDLRRVPFSQGLEYITLSYVWGDQHDKKEIILNGHPFPVGPNLYQALQDISQLKWFTEDSYLWVDAICINQDDNDEKSEQIPRMAQIYRSASQVIVSIVATDSRTELDFEFLCDLAHTCMRVKGWDVLFEFPASIWRITDNVRAMRYLDKKYGRDSWRERGRRSLKELFRLSWVSRIWVRQEVALATDFPTILVGKHHTDIGELMDLWTMTSDTEKRVYEPALLDVFELRFLLDKAPLARDARKSLTTPTSLLQAILSNAMAQSTLPSDRIYGTLGILRAFIEENRSESLPPQLAPDYNKNYEEVYHQYAVYILEKTQDLRLFLTKTRRLKDVPTWVPDFRYLIPHMEHSLPQTKADLRFLESGRELQLEGFQISVCHTSLPTSEISSDLFHLLNRVQEVESKIIEPAAAITGISVDILRDRLFQFLRNDRSCQWKDVYDELVSKDRPGECDGSVEKHLLIARSCALFLDGNVGWSFRIDADIDKGDLVCLFKGAIEPLVIRPAGMGKYTLVTPCALLNPIFDRENMDEELFQRNRCTTFILI
ncbi:HET-domain-containing protein [Hypomontagnella submonticulosa]|nr:HET-domain-containing protein [Hypomontagnella submonticulosa]